MRIVFASLGSLGDLHPLLALARAAGDRGHVAVIAASAGFRGYVESLGFVFHRIRPDLDPDPERMEYWSHPRHGPERLMREEIFPKVRDTYDDLVDAARGADVLVVGELLYVAPLVAAKLGIPWANVILSPSSFLSACDPCVLAPAPALHSLRHLGPWAHRLVFALGRFVTSRWSAPLLAFRRELGFPPGPSAIFEGKHSPRLVLAAFPKLLAAPQPDWPEAVVQTGFPFFAQSIAPELRQRIDGFLDAGEPPVVFTLGSTAVHIAPDFYEAAALAVRSLGRRAILLLGNNPAPAALDDSVLALDYAPLEALLPHAAAVVHHGGIGTCAEALRAGVPSLVIPFGFDQPDNAARLCRLGVAALLGRGKFSAARLTDALRAVLESAAMADRARELAPAIRDDPGASLDALEALSPGRPSLAVAR